MPGVSEQQRNSARTDRRINSGADKTIYFYYRDNIYHNSEISSWASIDLLETTLFACAIENLQSNSAAPNRDQVNFDASFKCNAEMQSPNEAVSRYETTSTQLSNYSKRKSSLDQEVNASLK